MEDRHSGGDRDCIGQQVRQARGHQRASALEAHLQQHRPGAVARDQHRCQHEIACDCGLGGDVACCESDPGGHAKGGTAAQDLAAYTDRCRRGRG
jgi:hypothetical protein